VSVRELLLVGIASLFLAACVNVEIVPKDFPYEAMISATDLGPGWQVEQTSFLRIDGALSSCSLTLRYSDVTDATQPESLKAGGNCWPTSSASAGPSGSSTQARTVLPSRWHAPG